MQRGQLAVSQNSNAGLARWPRNCPREAHPAVANRPPRIPRRISAGATGSATRTTMPNVNGSADRSANAFGRVCIVRSGKRINNPVGEHECEEAHDADDERFYFLGVLRSGTRVASVGRRTSALNKAVWHFAMCYPQMPRFDAQGSIFRSLAEKEQTKPVRVPTAMSVGREGTPSPGS